MVLFVNLSTTHDYSIQETIAAFVKLCNKYSNGCLRCAPDFFQTGTNYLWVMAQYQLHYKSLIEPYKLGNISTDDFLNNLAKIFYFMNDDDGDLDISQRNDFLKRAWNASIKITDMTQDRLIQLVNLAEETSQPVYLISNTNELNMQAILDLFDTAYPDLKFKDDIDISIKSSKEPIEILPNVFLCLSYRFKTFKTEQITTSSILEELFEKHKDKPVTVVSQFAGDHNKAQQIGISNIHTDSEFYDSEISFGLAKKNQ